MPSNVKDPLFDAVRFNFMLRPIADVEELQKKKQSDVLRFLLRVRCWEVRQPINQKSTYKPYTLPGILLWHIMCLAIHSLNAAESALK